MKALLIIKAVFFTMLFPGTVTIITPYFILKAAGENDWPPLTALTIFFFITGLAGAVILLYCIWRFAFYGKGTLAVIDPPKSAYGALVLQAHPESDVSCCVMHCYIRSDIF